MEQEKILSTLSEKLGETSFSPQTLQTYVELNPIAEGSEPDEAYWNKAVNFLKGMQGQYNHDVATRVKKVTAAMKAKQANDDYVLSKTLQGVTFDTKKTVDELVTEFLPKYDAEYKACRGYGTAPRTSDGSGGTQHNAASRYFERKGKKEGWKKN